VIASITVFTNLIATSMVVIAFIYIKTFMLVALKSKSTVALALITSWGIFANLVAVSVVSVALIYVCTVFPVSHEFVSRITLALDPFGTQEIDVAIEVTFAKQAILRFLNARLRTSTIAIAAQLGIL